MANSREQNLIQNRQKFSKSHETKQRDRPDQEKEKSELSKLVLIKEHSRDMGKHVPSAWDEETLLDAEKENRKWP